MKGIRASVAKYTSCVFNPFALQKLPDDRHFATSTYPAPALPALSLILCSSSPHKTPVNSSVISSVISSTRRHDAAEHGEAGPSTRPRSRMRRRRERFSCECDSTHERSHAKRSSLIIVRSSVRATRNEHKSARSSPRLHFSPASRGDSNQVCS